MHVSQLSAESRPRILLVEDDEDIAGLVKLHLAELEADLEHCNRGDTTAARIADERWNLLMLDIRLPGQSGLDLCRTLRERGDSTPVLMLTSKSSELDRVLGLELGADDYVTKPFSPLELTARVRAILRRASLQSVASPVEDESLQFGDLVISARDHTVTLGEQAVELTSREFSLLLHFARNPGRVFRRAELLDEVWGYGHDGYEHTVNSHINRLRAKIETEPAEPAHILTVWGVGYKFCAAGCH